MIWEQDEDDQAKELCKWHIMCQDVFCVAFLLVGWALNEFNMYIQLEDVLKHIFSRGSQWTMTIRFSSCSTGWIRLFFWPSQRKGRAYKITNSSGLELDISWVDLDLAGGQWAATVPGDGMKRNPERENFSMQPIASWPARSIHIRVTFNSVTQYVPAYHQNMAGHSKSKPTHQYVKIWWITLYWSTD